MHMIRTLALAALLALCACARHEPTPPPVAPAPAAAGAGATGGGVGSCRAQAHNASRAARASVRIMCILESAHTLHVGSHVADLLGGEALGEREHHRTVAARLQRVGPDV